MSNTNTNLDLRGSNRSFTLPDTPVEQPIEVGPQYCPDAQKLYEFAEHICEEALQNPSHVLLNQSRLKVLHRFLELYCAASKQHRGIRKSHVCLVTVFLDAMLTLRECELTIAPPQLYVPPPPPAPPPPPVISGVFIGELEDS